MRWIDKQKYEPKELTEFKEKLAEEREKEGLIHENPFNLLKDDALVNPAVQIALAKEQGYICCYCMGKIPIKEGEKERPVGRIEHFKPKSVYNGKDNKPDLRIEYSNLFLACENENNHCDIKKRKEELCEAFILIGKKKEVTRNLAITYSPKGVIHSKQEEINQDIGGELKEDNSGDYQEGHLNLNCIRLIRSRVGAWKAISRDITRLAGKDWNKPKALQIAKDMHKKYSSRKKDKKFYPFCEMILYQLEKRFKELKSA